MTVVPFVPIPEPLRCIAVAAKLPDQEIARRWRKYVVWHRSIRGPEAIYIVADWERHVGWAVKDARKAAKERAPLTESEAQVAQRRAREALEREQEAKAYTREAVPLAEWLQRNPELPPQVRELLGMVGGRR